jgi:hypothetical protein
MEATRVKLRNAGRQEIRKAGRKKMPQAANSFPAFLHS